MRNYKLKAGALQLVLFIVVVIALLLLAFILLIHTHKRFQVQTTVLTDTVHYAYDGIWSTVNSKEVKGDTLIISEGDNTTIKTHRSHWGIYDKVISKSNTKTYEYTKMGLLGGHSGADRVALTLKDNNKPLVLVGDVKIEGGALIPERGIRSGNIAGHTYYNSKYVYGVTKTIQSFPKLSSETVNHLKSLFKVLPDRRSIIDIAKRRIVKNSFKDELQWIYSESDIYLQNVQLIGHIVIRSNTKITIDASSQLKDVLIIAPEIVIKDGFDGTIQAIASKALTVGEDCVLHYPSALVLQKDLIETQESEPYRISINQRSVVKGSVIYLGKTNPRDINAQIILAPKSTVKGEIYCEHNLDLQGTVIGSVYTHNFITRVEGTVYQNHIYNGKILAKDLEHEYVGLPMLNEYKKVVKWLY